jgi:2-phospho-L-lactate/phosphoenolpyruvate guanylyltransferase
MILVPIKILADAKQRLSSMLTPDERFALAQAMCEDVLQALANWQGRPPVVVVTSDSFARDLAARFNFDVIADNNSGETSAIEMATAFCKESGAESTLVIPADIPLIDSSELQKIADCAPHSGGRDNRGRDSSGGDKRGGALLVPDAAGRGTNAAWRSPADLFPLRFGNDSFLPHLAAAKATGLPCIVLELPGIARDIDRPEDLYELAAARGERRSQTLVRSWNLARREQVYGLAGQ